MRDQRFARMIVADREPARKLWFWTTTHANEIYFMFLAVSSEIYHFLHNAHARFRAKHVETSIPVMHIHFWRLTQRAFAQVLKDRSNLH